MGLNLRLFLMDMHGTCIARFVHTCSVRIHFCMTFEEALMKWWRNASEQFLRWFFRGGFTPRIIRGYVEVLFEPIDQVTNRILDQYNRHPEGWSVLVDSQRNVLVVGPSSGYRLRLVPLNPQEYTGVGTKITSGCLTCHPWVCKQHTKARITITYLFVFMEGMSSNIKYPII